MCDTAKTVRAIIAAEMRCNRPCRPRFALAFVEPLMVSSGLEPGVTQGPLIDAKAVAKFEEHIADARAKAGKVLTGGKRHALGDLFFEPTLIAGVTADMMMAHKETFGLLAPICAFDTEAEVIALANDTEFGLAVCFYSRDIGRVMRVAERLESGMVGVNTGLISTAEAPFGGVKQSSLGVVSPGSTQDRRRYSPSEFVSAENRLIVGNPEEAKLSTSYVERQNLTMRMRMRRFTRLTNSFSEKVENLQHAVSLHFNFARIHSKRSANPSFVSAMKLRTLRLGNQRDGRGEHGSTANGALPGTGGGVPGLWADRQGMGRGERRSDARHRELVRALAALAGAA